MVRVVVRVVGMRVDLGHDERALGVHPEDGGVVDDDAAGGGRLGRVLLVRVRVRVGVRLSVLLVRVRVRVRVRVSVLLVRVRVRVGVRVSVLLVRVRVGVRVGVLLAEGLG